MEQSDLLRLAIVTLERLGIPYALVGSFASGTWRESRFTQDIDIVVRLDERSVATLCDEFEGDEFYVSSTAATDAVKSGGQFKVIHPASGNKIDFMIAGDSKWAESQLERRRQIKIAEDCLGYVASPEDVILGKLIYYNEGGSEKHFRDIAGIVAISGELLDRSYLDRWVAELGVEEGWRQVLAKCEGENAS